MKAKKQNTTADRHLRDYPKCVREVIMILENTDRPIKITELQNMTGYSGRSIRRALFKLFELNLVVKIPDLTDLRSHYLQLSVQIQN